MATDTRTRMIETTARLLQQRGLHGVSLNDILGESGAPRGSLYFHFPGGKEALVLEAMQAGIDEGTRVLRACLDDSRDPAEGVRAFFRAAMEELRGSDFTFGCPVAPVVLDFPDDHSALARACREAFDQWQAMYRDALVAAGIPPRRAGRLAQMILAGLEGGLLMARSQRRTAPLKAIAEELAAAIRGAMPA